MFTLSPDLVTGKSFAQDGDEVQRVVAGLIQSMGRMFPRSDFQVLV